MVNSEFDFSQFQFSPVIELGSDYEVYDFSRGYDPYRVLKSPYGVGRYNEKRPTMYKTPLFTGGEEVRDIHVGIDLAAPAGTPVRAFYDGVIFLAGINDEPGDYGGTVITEHRLGDQTLWALHGHLSHDSSRRWRGMEPIARGEVLGWLGQRNENGGWNPHLHFQLSWRRPEKCDLPGVVSERDRAEALKIYPDPRLVLGNLY
jgi:murein DD-endopeptidase MepM/ murein hydrolase activator NlpD